MTAEAAKSVASRFQVVILEPTEASPREFKERGATVLGYLDVLGVPASLLQWVETNHPDWLLYTESGEVARYWYGEYIMCNIASDSYKRYLVEKARQIVEMGYDGLFLDDVMIDPTQLGGPLYDTPVYNGSWVEHVVKLFKMIKEETGALVVYNAGWSPPDPRLMEVADGVMLESHPGSWEGDVNSPRYYLRDWGEIYNNSIVAQKYAERGKIVIALSYGNNSDIEFFSFAAVRLFDFYYAYSTPDLQTLPNYTTPDLGEPLGGHQSADGVYYRIYSRGLVALNPTDETKHLRVSVPHLGALLDVKNSRLYRGGVLTLELKPREGIALVQTR